MTPTVAADNAAIDWDRSPGLWARSFLNPDGTESRPMLTNIKVAGRKRASDRAATWLRVAMIALAVLALTAAVVSYQAQYVMIYAFKGVKVIAALQAGIPDAAALVFASLGIALALTGKRAIRARVLNVAAVGTSIVMNLLAASAGWKALAVWVLAPVAYAVTSDTLIGVLRSWTVARQRELNEDLAEDDSNPLAVIGRAVLNVARFVLAPRETARGARQAVLNATPLPAALEPALPTMFALPTLGAAEPLTARPQPAALPPATKRRAPRKPATTSVRPSKTQSFLKACEDKHGALGEIPLTDVYRISNEIAPEHELHPGSARSALRKAIQKASAR